MDVKFSKIKQYNYGKQGWRSGEGARLPPMCPSFDPRTQCHVDWVCCSFSTLLLQVFPGYSSFPLSLIQIPIQSRMYGHCWRSSCELLGALWVNKLLLHNSGFCTIISKVVDMNPVRVGRATPVTSCAELSDRIPWVVSCCIPLSI